MTATLRETLSLAELERALSVLTTAYKTPGGAANRCAQIKNFMSATFEAVADLAAQDGADAAYVAYDLPTVLQSIDCAFQDVVEAEDAGERKADLVRQYGTYSTLGGSVA